MKLTIIKKERKQKKILKKQEKLLLKSIKNNSYFILGEKLILFQEGVFSDETVKKCFEKIYPNLEFIKQEKTNFDLILNIYFKKKEVIK